MSTLEAAPARSDITALCAPGVSEAGHRLCRGIVNGRPEPCACRCHDLLTAEDAIEVMEFNPDSCPRCTRPWEAHVFGDDQTVRCRR